MSELKAIQQPNKGMIMKKIHLNIFTPDAIIIEQFADMVTLPGEEGEIGILSQHEPIILLLKKGDIRVYKNDVVKKTITISGGSARFSNEVCTVLADNIIGQTPETHPAP